MYKKAAMFGLDARIALAIFGALSVITGAALYSALQKAKTTATIVDIQEVIKAFEQFYIDTGKMPQAVDSAGYGLVDFIQSDYEGWKGPYLPYETYSKMTDVRYKDKFLAYDVDECRFFSLVKYRKSDFPYINGTSAGHVCPSDDDCGIYLAFKDVACTGASFMDFAKEIDKVIDGSDGLTTGKVRGSSRSDLSSYSILFLIGDKRNFE